MQRKSAWLRLTKHYFFRGPINNRIPHGIDNKLNETQCANYHLLICENRPIVQCHQPAETRPRSNFSESRVAFPRYNQAKLNTDETILMAGTEYFGETEVQPRDHIPVNTMRKSLNHTLGLVLARVKVHLQFCSHLIPLDPKSLFPKPKA